MPRLPAVSPHLSHLPVPLTTLIGREQDVAALRQSLRTGARLLTLTGAGGCGKTRLALQLAAELADEYPDGVRLVRLDALPDPALVAQAVATALAVAEVPQCSLVDTLTAALRSKTLLLVLDNCEHLVDACARLATLLLESAPSVQLLATSREPLRIPGEVTWPRSSSPQASHFAERHRTVGALPFRFSYWDR